MYKINNIDTKQYVIIVGASELVMPAYTIAREELGLGIVSLDYNSSAPGMLYADVAVNVSTKDVEAAVTAARDLAASLDIVGVFTCGADVEITVAAIAEALSLPGIPTSVARRCNDKLLMHQFLDQQKYTDKARYAVVHSAEQAFKAAADIGFPCVVKPLDNCASRGVQRVDSLNCLAEAYQLAVSHNGDRGGEILIEECLLGSKHTVEMIVWQGERHLLSMIDTHYISPRWPCETGLNTTTLSADMQRRVFDFASTVADLIGIEFGAHKVDINIAENGDIRLIELTARLSGGFHCQYASPLAFDSHDIRAALRLSVGEPLDLEDIRHRHEKGSAVRVVFPKPGRVKVIAGLEEAKALPGVEEVFVWTEVGARLGPYLNSADRPVFVIAVGDTTEQAIHNAEQGVAAIAIETE